MDAASWFSFEKVAASPETALAGLAEPVRAWFVATFGTPTLAQRHAWPIIARGDNVLLSTPTGSGKTLAAFLPLVSQLWTENRPGLHGLYVAPLKALGRDARKNLKRHCREIEARHVNSGIHVRVALRTGDTTQRVRQRQLADPPHFLLTTPESLAVLLSQPYAEEFFRTLRWLVVDEVHALASGKRGADLAISMERLNRLTERPLQRIGLSATCTPLKRAAEYLVGVQRACTVAQVGDCSPMELQVEPLPFEAGPGFMNRLVHRLENELHPNRTTLIFTNTRSLAERVTWALRKRFVDEAERIAVHHSALSAARRRTVERRLKQNKLWVAVTSTSLELGIDIGSAWRVVFVHPPGSVVRFLQRLGRSGHGPDQLRRGLVLTASNGALLEATVTAASGRYGQLEALDVARQPLDVLCQQLAGMAMSGSWSADNALDLVRRAAPFRDLSRDDFNVCLDYLSGRHPDGTAWLPSRLQWESDVFTIVSPGTAKLLRRNLGTILSEDQCAIRHEVDGSREEDLAKTVLVGEVDEVYADRLEQGDRFMLDGRCWEVRRRARKELMVDEVLGRPQVPQWLGSGVPMSVELAERIYLFGAQAAEALRDGPASLEYFLQTEYALNLHAAEVLTRFFVRQETISEIPETSGLLVEAISYQSCTEYCFHTPLPRLANEVLARVASMRVFSRLGMRAITLAADLGFLVVFERPIVIEPARWRELLSATSFEEDFTTHLSDGNLVRERFAQVAQTGLMVLRSPAGRRRKVGGRDWAARELFDQVRAAEPSFVLLRQAEREARQGACDLETALAYVRQLPQRLMRLRWLTQPSPLADRLVATSAGTPANGTRNGDAFEQELLKAKVG